MLMNKVILMKDLIILIINQKLQKKIKLILNMNLIIIIQEKIQADKEKDIIEV